MFTSIKISQAEYHERTNRLNAHLQSHNLSGVVLFNNDYILYYTGFSFIPTERPIAYVLNRQGEKALFVPRLKQEQAEVNAIIDRVVTYAEYPDTPHPMTLLISVLENMGIREGFGVDTDGYPWIFGYRGPTLSELTQAKVIRVAEFIEDQLMIKSPAELEIIKESVKWGHLAHVLLQRYTRVGATETEVCQRASHEATLAMLDTIGPTYQAQGPFFDGAGALYRGQIGRNAAYSPARAKNITFQVGDVLVTEAGAPVWGYHSELERTMVIGPPTEDQKRMFDHMLALQETALSAMKPGVKCAQVDQAARNYYEKHELMPYWKHHVGHGIGLRYHEGPFLDLGDQTVLTPGMVFTVEPGLYTPDLGGFRHSDTVAVTETGIEILTYYPRDLASLTLPL